VNAVTGALSYTGRAIAEELLGRGQPVRSLSRRDDPADPLRAQIELRPLVFDDTLTGSLAGVEALYNTYWIRFERGRLTFDRAVQNSIALFEAARRAGVRRVVHVSVSQADGADDLPYFRGKHRLEEWLAASDLDWAIVRPTLVFGPSDILVNNIAWILRRFPLFLVPDGDAVVQPVSLRDTARLCVDAAAHTVSDAAGPETFGFKQVVELVRDATRARARVVRAPRPLGLALTRAANIALRDVVVTRDELEGLGRSLLVSRSPPLGHDRFTDWVEEAGSNLGREYASELARNFRGQE
jgi:uncharacterized protein YbjT (DUF2867 family)